MDNVTHEPQAPYAISENPLDSTFDFPDDYDSQDENALSSSQGRHDGWTGQRMAMFCALLAETGIVTDACTAVGMSTTSAYGARRRNPLFAAAWEESLRLARDRLADALLERSLNGCLEKYYKDGELVGEKRLIDNRLGMQVLRRLDKRAQQLGITASVRAERAPAKDPDWDLMLSALRSGEEGMIAEALAETARLDGEGHTVGEVGEVCVARIPDGEVDADEPPERCWRDEDGCWWTDFPPPPNFSGEEEGKWGNEAYKRECTRDEAEALNTALDAEIADDRAEDETLRDAWFTRLKAGLCGSEEAEKHESPSRE